MKKLIIIIGVLISSMAFSQVRMKKQDGGILFTENNEKVLFYQMEPKSLDGKYERCNYIHPLWGMGGEVLTEDFPEDHLHHRGIFWAWHQIWIDTLRVGDGWALIDFQQDITNVEYTSQKNGEAVLHTVVDWKSDKWKEQGVEVPYLREKTKITIHPKDAHSRQIDFEIQLQPLVSHLKLGGSEDVKGYSGFSVRMILPEDIKFEGVNGAITPENTAVASPGYVNMFGTFKNGKEGIVMFDHPNNPDYPQSWILRYKRSMQNIAYPGTKTVDISNEKPLVLKYSLLVYEGNLASKKIKKVMGNF